MFAAVAGALAGAVVVGGLALARGADAADGSIGRDATASAPPAAVSVVDPAPGGSGVLAPWQQLAHARSFDPTFAAAAADPRGVLLVGDSIASRIRTPLLADASRAKRTMSWDHWNGRPTHGAVDAVIALRAAHRLPRTLVVVSGSNDVFEPTLFAAQVERLLAAVGPDTVVYWVSPHVARPAQAAADAAHTRMLDDALRAAAASHPNLHLVDWPGALAARSEAERTALVPDGVHPSPAGAAALSDLVMAALS